MKFGSDNWAGVSDKISTALHDAREGCAPGYGADALTNDVTRRFCDIFQTDITPHFVATGSAANSLLLASTSRPGGVIFAHKDAHINVDEAMGPEFFSGGAKICAVEGENGKILPGALREAIARFPADLIHHGQPVAVSITQATEIGTLYSLEEISEIGDVTHAAGLPLHMDGARFTNALVTLDVDAADMSWRAGVDLLSFGGTKNGCWCAEAAIIFNESHSRDFLFHRKRAGQLFSKSRFIAAQFNAYLAGDHWLDLARHANAMASVLVRSLEQIRQVQLVTMPQSNEIFVYMSQKLADALLESGAAFYAWPSDISSGNSQPAEGEGTYRFVTSFATTEKDIADFIELLRANGAGH